MRAALAALALCALLILQTAPATRAQSTTSTSPEMTMDSNSTADGNSTEAAGNTTETSATDAAEDAEEASGAGDTVGEEAGSGTDAAGATEDVVSAGEQGSTAGGTTAAADGTGTTGEGAVTEGESSAAAGGEDTTSAGSDTSEGVTASAGGGTTAADASSAADGNSTMADGNSTTAEGATTPAGEASAAGGEDSSSSAGGTTSAGGDPAATGSGASSSGGSTGGDDGTTASSGGTDSSDGQVTGGSGGGGSNGQGTDATGSSGSEGTGTTAAGGGGTSGSGGTATTAVPEATTQANKVMTQTADVKVRVRLSFRDQQFSAALNDSSSDEAKTKGAELATKVKDALQPQLALTGVNLTEVATLAMWSGSVVADMDAAVTLPTDQLASLQEMVNDAVDNVTTDGTVGTEPINSDVTQVSVIECTNTPPEPLANMRRTWSGSNVLGSKAVYTCFDGYELKTSSGVTLPELNSDCSEAGTSYLFSSLGTGNSCEREPTTAPPTTTTRATTPTTTASTTTARPTVPTKKYVPSDIGTYDNKYFFSVTLPAMGGILVALVILLCCVRIDSPLCKVCAEGKV